MSYDASPDLLDRNLVFDFFWLFSAFECALKRDPEFLKTGWSGAAEPDWDKFGERVRDRFGEVRTEGFLEAVSTLMGAAPRRQVVHNGQLDWKGVVRRPGRSDEEFVIDLLIGG